MAASKVLNWVIYVLKCPRTRQVRYVGFTSKALEARLGEHIRAAARRPHQDHKHQWIASLFSIGLIPDIEAIATGSGDGWAEAERHWIAAHRAQGARLVNGTDGGEGVIGWGTPEQRSAAAKKRQDTLGPERRSASARKAIATRTPAQCSDAARKFQAAKTPAQRSAARRKGHLTMGQERSSEAARKRWAAKTPEQRSEVRKKGWAALSPEQRTAQAIKGHATRAAKRLANANVAASSV